jgi:hypothetical protein
MDELDKQIKELEEAWDIYHADKTRTLPMPDMMQLAKLRAQRERLKRAE